MDRPPPGVKTDARELRQESPSPTANFARREVGGARSMDEVWDPHWFGPTKTLDVHISWLRKKVEDDPASPRYITTVRGVGFRFASAADMPTSPGPDGS